MIITVFAVPCSPISSTAYKQRSGLMNLNFLPHLPKFTESRWLVTVLAFKSNETLKKQYHLILSVVAMNRNQNMVTIATVKPVITLLNLAQNLTLSTGSRWKKIWKKFLVYIWKCLSTIASFSCSFTEFENADHTRFPFCACAHYTAYLMLLGNGLHKETCSDIVDIWY